MKYTHVCNISRRFIFDHAGCEEPLFSLISEWRSDATDRRSQAVAEFVGEGQLDVSRWQELPIVLNGHQTCVQSGGLAITQCGQLGTYAPRVAWRTDRGEIIMESVGLVVLPWGQIECKQIKKKNKIKKWVLHNMCFWFLVPRVQSVWHCKKWEKIQV